MSRHLSSLTPQSSWRRLFLLVHASPADQVPAGQHRHPHLHHSPAGGHKDRWSAACQPARRHHRGGPHGPQHQPLCRSGRWTPGSNRWTGWTCCCPGSCAPGMTFQQVLFRFACACKLPAQREETYLERAACTVERISLAPACGASPVMAAHLLRKEMLWSPATIREALASCIDEIVQHWVSSTCLQRLDGAAQVPVLNLPQPQNIFDLPVSPIWPSKA